VVVSVASPLPYLQQMWQTARVPAFRPAARRRVRASATGAVVLRRGVSGPGDRW
jgi:hypothetical protein